MRDIWMTLAAHRKATWTVGLTLLLTLVLAVGGAAFWHVAGRHDPQAGDRHAIPARASTGRAGHPASPGPQPPSPGERDAAGEVAGLRAARPVTSAYSARHRRITGQTAHHPDLYARAFTKALLTQDYRTPRAELLAWVQAESASTNEPKVIGLVPPSLRGKWAVYSVTDDQAPPPIPTQQRWQTLAARHGQTTVRIQRVTEPVAWSSAVLAGDITDPGVTAREVDALLTLHTLDHERRDVQRFSVALTMNLEGPPTRDQWGFVTAVTYDVVPLAPPR